MAQRRALPIIVQIPFVALALWIGLAYRYGSPVRTATESFDTARDIAQVSTWGLAFLVGGVVMAAGLFHQRLQVFAFMIGGGVYILWGLFFAEAASAPTASLTGWALYAFIGFTHYLAAWRIYTDVKAGRS